MLVKLWLLANLVGWIAAAGGVLSLIVHYWYWREYHKARRGLLRISDSLDKRAAAIDQCERSLAQLYEALGDRYPDDTLVAEAREVFARLITTKTH